jgi:hypothetical protein
LEVVLSVELRHQFFHFLEYLVEEAVDCARNLRSVSHHRIAIS